jgi:hypothetical protein
MSVDDDHHTTRRERLANRQRRYRWTGVLVASVIVGAAGTVAAFAYTDAEPPAVAPEVLVGASDAGAEPSTTSTSIGTEEVEVRPLSHDEPLRLLIAGDSLAGALGPALGASAGATGIVEAHVDYKVSSGLEPGVRDWPEYAESVLTERDPEAVVFMIGTNDSVLVNSQDANDDGVEDWEPDYRAKVGEMMDLLVGGDAKRTVIWIGPPTMRDDDRDDAVVELNRVMREEAASRSPYVMFLDAYARFGDPEDGGYTDRLEVDGETVRVRVGDGVHLTPAGAEYLATSVFASLDGRFRLAAQADPENPIEFSMQAGGESTRGGSGTRNNGNGSGSGGGGSPRRSTTTVPPDPDPADDGTGEGGETATTVETPETTPPTDPPPTAPPTTQAPPAEPSV